MDIIAAVNAMARRSDVVIQMLMSGVISDTMQRKQAPSASCTVPDLHDVNFLLLYQRKKQQSNEMKQDLQENIYTIESITERKTI